MTVISFEEGRNTVLNKRVAEAVKRVSDAARVAGIEISGTYYFIPQGVPSPLADSPDVDDLNRYPFPVDHELFRNGYMIIGSLPIGDDYFERRQKLLEDVWCPAIEERRTRNQFTGEAVMIFYGLWQNQF